MYKVVKVQLSSVKLDQEMFCSAFFFICSLKVKLKAWNDNQRIYFLFNEKSSIQLHLLFVFKYQQH